MVTRNVFQVLKFHSPAARAILRTFKTSLVPIYHVMHSRSYDFLYLFQWKWVITLLVSKYFFVYYQTFDGFIFNIVQYCYNISSNTYTTLINTYISILGNVCFDFSVVQCSIHSSRA